MTRHSATDELATLRAARPKPPAVVLDPDGDDARRLLARVLAEPAPAAKRRAPGRGRVGIVIGLSAATAAAAIAVLIAVPDRADERAVTAPPTTEAVAAPASVATASAIDPNGPRTATATLNVNGQVELMTMAGDDISIRFRRPGTGIWLENRRVDGVLYTFTPVQTDDGVGEPFWHYDPNERATLTHHPDGTTPFELYAALSAAVEFEEVDVDEIDGIALTQLRALDPGAIDGTLVPSNGVTGSVRSLDLWVTENGVVLRMDATVEAWEEEHAILLEFADVGDPDIVVEAPEDAVELDAVG